MMAVPARPVKDILPSKRVCRKLFGEPDHEETRRILSNEMSRIDQQNKQRWSFDFASEEPLTGGRYEWEKVEAEENVPQAYAMPHLDIKLLARCLQDKLEDRPVTPTQGLAVPLRCASAPITGRPVSPDSSSSSSSGSVSQSTQTVDILDICEPLSVDTDSISVGLSDSQMSPAPRIRSLKRKQRHITDYFSQAKRSRTEKH